MYEKFPCYDGEVAVVAEFCKRTLWDKLKRRYRVQYAFSFCSPEDLEKNYSSFKGYNIARSRLDIFQSNGKRRESLYDRCFAGEEIYFGRAPTYEEVKSDLNLVAHNSIPYVWIKNIVTKQLKALRFGNRG